MLFLRKEGDAEDGGGVRSDTKMVVGTEADEPENGVGGIGDDELAALFKDGKFKVGKEIADKAMTRHSEGAEGVTLADGTEG